MKVKAFLNAIKRSPKTIAIIAAVAGTVLVPAALLAWGPNRPTYTMMNPADHITFDSITDNPAIGDERNFVGVRETGSNEDWNDTEPVQAGKQYTVRMYVHNNAASNLNLVAHNVTAMFNLPTTTGKSLEVNGFITSSNATPNQVFDNATFTSDKDFNLVYKPNSLVFANNIFPNGTPISTSAFTSAGAKLGYQQMDGNIPGCNQYSGWLSFVVTPQFGTTTSFDVTKQVKKTGTTGWQKSVTVNNGDNVDYLIGYKNTSNANEDDVMVNDKLPAGINYVAGSTQLTNAAHTSPLTLSDNLTNGTGVNIGGYTASSNAYVKFTAKVDDPTLVCGTKTYTNTVRVDVNGGYKQDSADVVVNKTCQPGQTPPTELPTTGIESPVTTLVGLGLGAAGAAYAATSKRVRSLLRG
jgi:uncharacterized repeat protein (TIGR01451 family)/LPXTG-motif cell wall-anchored protein